MAERVNLKTSTRPARQLVFDRRYGWVIDEWKHPSEEALAGGRGMFCIVPLARVCLENVLQSIKLVSKSTIMILERPDILSPQTLQTNLGDLLQKFVSPKKSGSDLELIKKNSICESTTGYSNVHGESSESNSIES